ncbi:MAG: nitrite reductase small subunit NirD [Gammaproteobacteria bacterium]|jgi:NAD(P)H-dependent nitrite reductase small subunit
MNAKVELEWLPVCKLDDVLPNLGVCAKVADRQVAIFRIADTEGTQLFAIDNHDPISEANVLSRGIVGDLKGHIVVASPVYKQHFDLVTGQCLEDDICVPVYPVREQNGQIEVMVS